MKSYGNCHIFSKNCFGSGRQTQQVKLLLFYTCNISIARALNDNCHIGGSMKFLNLREGYSVESAIATVEIEVEFLQKEGGGILKVLHGYGSHGRGGVICIELRKNLMAWKRRGFIKDYFTGDKWNIFDPATMAVLEKDKSIYGDQDLFIPNPGITIIVV